VSKIRLGKVISQNQRDIMRMIRALPSTVRHILGKSEAANINFKSDFKNENIPAFPIREPERRFRNEERGTVTVLIANKLPHQL
jgi:hypothetical protein